MRINILKEEGFKEALLGLGLSYDVTSNIFSVDEMINIQQKLYEISLKLYNKEGGHNKFLESIQIWVDIDAPRYFWSEYDTFRVGTSKQSESTMHTIKKKEFTINMFETNSKSLKIFNELIPILNRVRVLEDTETIKQILPEAFLQRRIVSTNYKVLRNIIYQRRNHKLKLWPEFCHFMVENVEHPEYFSDLKINKK